MPYEQNNLVEPIIDGVAFFAKLAALIKTVELAGPDPKSQAYIHARVWWCDINADLGGGVNFGSAIVAAANAEHEVRLLLWLPSDKQAQQDEYNRLKAEHVHAKAVLEAASPYIKVGLIEQKNDDLAAYHEKTFIFRTGDGVEVLLGGLNVANPYRDQKPHNHIPNWHDVGVHLVGPATTLVENDFKTDWPKADWTGAAPSLLPQLTPSAVAATPVLVASTTLAPTSIHDELIARVKVAQKLIYMENYSIHHPDLIAEIANRIAITRSTASPVQAIIVTNDVRPLQTAAADDEDPAVYSWLHFVTYVQLSIASCNSFTYESSGTSHTQQRTADLAFQRGSEPWYQDSQVTWRVGSTTMSVPIKDIRSFDGDTKLYRGVYTAAPAGGANPTKGVYVHAKTAIFDDDYALIGSANFCPRSLTPRDGELSIFFSGGAVAAYRTQLWGHWFNELNPPVGPHAGPSWPTVPIDATAWKAAADALLKMIAAGQAPADQLAIVPIDFKEYSREVPDLAKILTARVAAVIAAGGHSIIKSLPVGAQMTAAGAASAIKDIDSAKFW